MPFSDSMPLSVFPTEGDAEKIPEGLPTSNSAFEGDVSGVEANHSSQITSFPPSVPGQFGQAEGAQWNDDEDRDPSQGRLDPPGYDPNMSGPHATQPIAENYAGGMNGAYGGMQAMDCADDYKTWLPSGSLEVEFGSDSTSPQGSFSGLPDTISSIQVFPVIRRM